MTREEMTREEAIEIVGKNMPSDKSLPIYEALQTLIPELRESEDERIRKRIIALVEAFGQGTHKNNMLAWLEKQKEQPTDAKLERVIKAARRVLNNWLDGSDCPDVSGDFGELEFAIREYDGEEKQKEQKPVENGTRTKIIIRATNEKQVVLLSESNGNAEIDWDTRSLEDTKRLLEYGIAFINKRLGTKPAEWSEEDEDTYNQVYYLFRDARDEWYKAIFSGCYPKITRDKVLAMLKSLHSRPKASDNWKPGEEQSMPSCKSCGFYENNCPFIRDTFKPYPNKVCKDYTYSAMKEQEQPEVDLEKEMDRFFEEMPVLEYENIFEETYQMIARHFYELGLNAKKKNKHERD